jgi:hypothetical protein
MLAKKYRYLGESLMKDRKITLHSTGKYRFEVLLNGEKVRSIFMFTGTWHYSVDSGGSYTPMEAAEKLINSLEVVA